MCQRHWVCWLMGLRLLWVCTPSRRAAETGENQVQACNKNNIGCRGWDAVVLPGWDALGRVGQAVTTQTKLSWLVPNHLGGSWCWTGLSKYLVSLSVNSGASGARRAGLKEGWAVTYSCPSAACALLLWGFLESGIQLQI